MSSGGRGSDDSGKQPFSSISDVFSSLFSHGRSATAARPALLTAFRELPEVKDCPSDASESKQEKEEEPRPRDVEKKNDATEPELVQVTKVETYSDTENEEDGKAAYHSCLRPKGDEDEPRCESESECEVPVFRSHKLERSCIEEMLHAEKSRWKNHSRTAGADARPPESSSVSEGRETPKSSGKVGTAESGKYARIDCSLPVPSIISGPTGLEAAGQDAAADSHRTESSGMKEGTAESSEGPFSDRSASSPKEPPIDQSAPSASSASSRNVTPPSPFSFQMPPLFSGLRVLKKGAVGEDRDTTAEVKQREKDADLALLSLKKSVNKAKLYPEQKTPSPGKKQPQTGQPANTPHGCQEANGKMVCEEGEAVAGEERPGTPEKRTTSDQAYETFRSLFGTRAARKEKTDDVDLEAIKRKIRSDKENLKSIFERVSRTPSKELKSPTEAKVRFPPLFNAQVQVAHMGHRWMPRAESVSPSDVLPRVFFIFVFTPQAEVTSPTDSEDRTPGRLQAVWPPPKPKDEEEKVGLKYTEAGKKHRPARSSVTFYCFLLHFYSLA